MSGSWYLYYDFFFFLMAPCFFLGATGAWLFSRFGKSIGFIDYPKSRSSHEIPVPRGGGFGIWLAFLYASYYCDLSVAVWGPTAFVSLVSLYGDRFDVSPKARLLFQFMAAFAFLYFHPTTDLCLSSQLVCFCLLIIFLVGTANFYNFMDGINGIAGLMGVAGCALVGWFVLDSGADVSIAIFAGSIAFACLGFLPFNLPTAKVFMGDTGSILLGFLFGQLVIILSKDLSTFICISSFLFLFYADEIMTMGLRLVKKENLFKAHRKHFYQLLANEGKIAHWKISAGYFLCQLLIGASVIWSRQLGLIWELTAILFWGIGFMLIYLNIGIKKYLRE